VILRKITWTLLVAIGFWSTAAHAQSNDSVEHYAEEGQSALAAGRYADAEKAF